MSKSKNFSMVDLIILPIMFILVAFGVYLYKYHTVFYNTKYVEEDHLIEWLTVIGLFLCFCICAKRIFTLCSEKKTLFIFCLSGFAALFIFGIGEEISWGQRIFDIESSKFFMEYNSQGETNLHNLKIGGVKLNKLLFGLILAIVIIIYLVAIPVAYIKTEIGKKFVNNFAIPLPRPVHIICYVVLFLMLLPLTSGSRGELLEFGGVCIFICILAFPYNAELFLSKKNVPELS